MTHDMASSPIMNAPDRVFVFLARRSWRFYKLASRDVTITRDGTSLKVPIRHGLGLAHLKPAQSWMENAVARTYARRQGLFVDVGANIGQTLLAVQRVSPGVDYIALEPDPDAYRYLESLVAANHWTEVHVLPQALGSRPGVLELHHSGAADVSASLVDALRPRDFFTLTTQVHVERGDDLLARLHAGPMAVLKIDVEGGELDVVEGLEERIARDHPVIIVEVLGYGPILSGRVFPDITDQERRRIVDFRRTRTQALENRLRGEGYVFARLLEDGGEQSVESLDQGPDGEIECNYIARPAELASM